jgi:uncharacterized repeat protein (TIGR03803 family)
MRGKKSSAGLGAVSAIFAASLLMTGRCATAQTEKVLFNFHAREGNKPYAGLIFDASGNLYGTTSSGGADGYGVVFELSPATGGTWAETVLHSFSGGEDGRTPYAGLAMDAAGNLYGTTYDGGAGASCTYKIGCGTVFELTRTTGGVWTEKVLHAFGDGTDDGVRPYANLIFDSAGNLYGTTFAGGSFKSCSAVGVDSGHYGCGTVFELSPTANGWTEQILYNFDEGTNGQNPYAGLIFDSSGRLYGTTEYGGTDLGCGGEGYADTCGTAFLLTPKAGVWSESLLPAPVYGFITNLTIDATGNVYGTNAYGGGPCLESDYAGCGVVYELSPTAGGNWSSEWLWSFASRAFTPDGAWPSSGPTLDAEGNLYGSTSGYVNENGVGEYGGTVYRLSPTAGGWAETLLYVLSAGSWPSGGLVFDVEGNVYGTTREGGTYNQGTVFEITP